MPANLPATATNKQEAEKINFLIGGKNGGNMDTMMIAQVDTVSRKIKLISVPRDLFMDGRKLNSYSIDQIKEYLGVITGLHIDHYGIVDMYAYIEVVDILGGIDIYLDKPVVDKTYKTIDNGVVGTLNYEAGWHHLSGVQSLRLARSRHSTSDFARAERQQEIIKALKKKVSELSVTDATQVLQIANSILSKIDTDLTVQESVTYVLKFKSFEVEPRGVLSTGNVLTSEMYVPPGANNCSVPKNDGSGETVPVNCGAKAIYILKPSKDWNSVRWYVAELLKD